MFFEIGEKIVCVDDTPTSLDRLKGSLLYEIYLNTKLPVKGEIYTFRRYYVSEWNNDKKIGLYVEELTNPIHPITGNEICYSLKRFAKLQNLFVSTEFFAEFTKCV